eukprot:scaffold468711_cov27-Prasinocladus_malaysianus.AAC.1
MSATLNSDFLPYFLTVDLFAACQFYSYEYEHSNQDCEKYEYPVPYWYQYEYLKHSYLRGCCASRVRVLVLLG